MLLLRGSQLHLTKMPTDLGKRITEKIIDAIHVSSFFPTENIKNQRQQFNSTDSIDFIDWPWKVQYQSQMTLPLFIHSLLHSGIAKLKDPFLRSRTGSGKVRCLIVLVINLQVIKIP